MYPTIQLPLLPDWQSHQETLLDNEIEISHLEVYLPDDKRQADKGLIDIYAGQMPENSSAEKEALRSYEDIVGDGEEDPLTIWPFQGKEAFGYEVICDDDSIMRVMCVEWEPGLLLILNVVGQDEELFETAVEHVEKHLTLL